MAAAEKRGPSAEAHTVNRQPLVTTASPPKTAPPPGDHQRDTMSPLFRPVAPDLDITTPAGVDKFFPNLAEVRPRPPTNHRMQTP